MHGPFIKIFGGGRGGPPPPPPGSTPLPVIGPVSLQIHTQVLSGPILCNLPDKSTLSHG